MVDKLVWSPARNSYEFLEAGRQDQLPPGETGERWLAWLEERASFAFQGKHGRLTLRKERRPRGGDYWYAYRRQGRRVLKKYLGKSAELTVARLEEAARSVQAESPVQAGQAPILAPKLQGPRLHSSVLTRTRLFSRLDAGLERKLTLVNAPTGFGKTTLVSGWIADRQLLAAWVTLDENDNDPVRFWTYVITALRAFDAALGKTALAALMVPQPVFLQNILIALINDLQRLSKNCVLVLDDYQAIVSGEINASVSFLLQHLPASLHLILVARRAPDLPLAILRARDELVELDAASLRFSLAETETFLGEVADPGLPAPAAARLYERTEGWVAGLRLAALSLQNKGPQEVDRFIQIFSGSHRYIADYLITEVFESQPEAVQDFLLRTCFLSRLTGSLCDAVRKEETIPQEDSPIVSHPSVLILEQLERENLFIVRLENGGAGAWYRYQALFAETLQWLARQRLGEEGVQALSEKASGWFEARGLLDEAVETALAARLYERALALIEKYIEIHDITELRTLGRWLASIPEPEILRLPEISFSYAQVILYSAPDRFAPATAARLEPFLSAAENIWREQEDDSRLGELFSFRGNVDWWQGDFEKAFLHAHQSLVRLSEHQVFWRGNSLLIASNQALNLGRIWEAQEMILEARALLGAAQNIFGVLAALQVMSEVFAWQGEFEQAEELNRQILKEAVGDESMLDDQGMAALGLAHILYERNDLAQAGEFAGRALELARQRGNEILQVQAATRLGLLYAAGGDPARARATVHSLAAGIQNPASIRDVQDTQALLALRANDLAALEGWRSARNELAGIETQAAGGAGKPGSRGVQIERRAFLLARLQLAEGKARQALETLEGWGEEAARHGRLRSQVEALSLEALAHDLDGDPKKAGQALLQALAIGQAKGFRRLFLDEGTKMAALLQAVLPSLPNRALSLYVTSLLRSFSPEAVAPLALPGSAGLIEPLSRQELRVLRLLVAGLSNADIARELVVSPNTVKTQVRSIYRKLNVNSREDAREAAREFNLI
jgi:LuxR family maltose regulon positive regulatory protein